MHHIKLVVYSSMWGKQVLLFFFCRKCYLWHSDWLKLHGWFATLIALLAVVVKDFSPVVLWTDLKKWNKHICLLYYYFVNLIIILALCVLLFFLLKFVWLLNAGVLQMRSRRRAARCQWCAFCSTVTMMPWRWWCLLWMRRFLCWLSRYTHCFKFSLLVRHGYHKPPLEWSSQWPTNDGVFSEEEDICAD